MRCILIYCLILYDAATKRQSLDAFTALHFYRGIAILKLQPQRLRTSARNHMNDRAVNLRYRRNTATAVINRRSHAEHWSEANQSNVHQACGCELQVAAQLDSPSAV
jgi:hypothetical protein